MKDQCKDTCIKRGFVTIATGNEKYYKLALSLLRSYRQNSKDSAPFALICDRDCPEAREFDDFVVMQDAKRSYLDKLMLCRYTPYEETIFIDADAMILGDTRPLWGDFSNQEDFSCYGRKLKLDSKDGWFFYEEMGDLKPKLSFGISMHGGLYFLRKTQKCKDVFETALYYAENYDQYRFANFKNPADEPVLALAMALKNMKPCQTKSRIIFLPSNECKLRINMNGELMLKNKPCDAVILHFGNRHTPRFLYQYYLAMVEYKRMGGIGALPMGTRMHIRLRTLPLDSKVFCKQILKRILPSKVIECLKSSK